MERGAKRSRLDDSGIPTGRHAKRSRFDDFGGHAKDLDLDDSDDSSSSIRRRAERMKLDGSNVRTEWQAEGLKLPGSRDLTRVPRKTSHPGSLLTALNRPLYVPLLRLPSELRNRIWQYSLRSDDGICAVNEHENFPEPGLLSTCTQIRREAIGIFHFENEFSVTITSYCPSMAIFMFKRTDLMRRNFAPPVMRLTANMQGPPSWKNLLAWLKGVHQGNASNFTSPPGAKSMRNSVHRVKKNEEFEFLSGLFATTHKMRGEPWEAVESILDMLRYGLQQFDQKWAKD